MFRSLMTRTVAVAIGLVGVLGFVNDTAAGFNIRITLPGPPSLSNPFTVADGGVNIFAGAQDVDGTISIPNNVVDISNTAPMPGTLVIGNFTFKRVEAHSVPGPANYLTYQYDIIYSGAGASGPVTIEYSRTNYTSGLGLNTLTASDSITFGASNTAVGTQQITNSYASGNVDFGTGVDLVGTTKTSGPTGSFNDNLSTTFITTNVSYTLTSKVTLNFGGAGEYLGGGTISLAPPSGVPVPAGLVLALTGLPALGLFSRLRRRNVQA